MLLKLFQVDFTHIQNKTRRRSVPVFFIHLNAGKKLIIVFISTLVCISAADGLCLGHDAATLALE
jgi:hypothetical protein